MLSRCARRGGNDSGYTASPNKKLSVKAETFLKSPENLCEFVGVHVGIRCPDYKRKRVPQSVIHSTRAAFSATRNGTSRSRRWPPD